MRIIGLLVAALLLLTACGSTQSQVESDAHPAPEGKEKVASLVYLAGKKPEDAKVGGSPAQYRGILMHSNFTDGTINTDEWKADVLLPDGRLITIRALDTDARELTRTAKNGDYIACNPSGDGGVDVSDVVILETGAVAIS